MKQETIMTTNIEIITAYDLSLNNEVINLSQIQLLGNEKIAGVSLTLICELAYNALFAVVTQVYRLIINQFPEYHILLFTGNSAWQPDTRIVRHHKLWGAMRLRGIEIPKTKISDEIYLELEGKIKFFGVMQLSDSTVHVAVKTMLNEKCTYLVALPSHVDTQKTLEIGWTGSFSDDTDIIVNIYKQNGFLIKRYGEFDDPEKGVVLIGKPELIQQVARVGSISVA
jgi:hypothetical protein